MDGGQVFLLIIRKKKRLESLCQEQEHKQKKEKPTFVMDVGASMT